ncbi:Aldo/keto reductase, partial [Clavulina sp. PMI_390]
GSGSVNKGTDTHENIEAAVRVGFRHLDTAQFYRNEQYVGVAIRDVNLQRSELYITTKYGRFPTDPVNRPIEALKDSLQKLGLDYVNLYLIHSPGFTVDDLPTTWNDFIKIRDMGLAKSIGVSNCTVHDLLQLAKSSVTPAINQIQLHPYNYAKQAPTLAYAAKNSIVIEAYGSLAPITSMPGGPLDPVLDRLAKARKATPAQVVFLWVMAKGAVIVTTSSKEERMKEYIATANLSFFMTLPRFVAPLSPEEVLEIDVAGATKWSPPSAVSWKRQVLKLPNRSTLIWRVLVLLLLSALFFGVTQFLGTKAVS